MSSKIFINLPVKDLDRSVKFFTALGYSINPKFSDATCACVVISEHIYAMVLTHEKFKEFTPKTISDATKSTEVLIALSFESRAKVEEVVEKALASGGSRYAKAKDYGFMYQDGFQDPDGHIWEVFYMDPAAAQ